MHNAGELHFVLDKLVRNAMCNNKTASPNEISIIQSFLELSKCRNMRGAVQ